MAYINLLPWREEAQKAKQKEYFMILGAVATSAIAIALLVGQFYQMRVDGQNSKNQYLKNEIQLLDVKIAEIKGLNEKKSELESRISVVEQLQRSRNVGTQVLDEITKIVPNGIYLTSLDKQGNMLELVGKSESNNHLANMIREIESSNLLADAQLSTISSKNTKSRLLSDFNMRVRIKGLVNDIEKAQASVQGGK
ncbi:PilN domain-containing protein [Thalassotalea agariperforans]